MHYDLETLGDALKAGGLVDVQVEKRGTLPVFGVDKPQAECLIAYGKMP